MPPKKPAAKPAAAKPDTIKGPTKTELYRRIAEETGLTRAQVKSVFDALVGELEHFFAGRVPAGGKKDFTVPDIVKLTARHKPATPARPGKNPFTGEMMTFQAKPARTALRAAPVKKMKDATGAGR